MMRMFSDAQYMFLLMYKFFLSFSITISKLHTYFYEHKTIKEDQGRFDVAVLSSHASYFWLVEEGDFKTFVA